MPRDEKGRFLAGYDAERHVFTSEEIRRGYDNAVESIRVSLGHLTDYYAKKALVKRMYRTESRRYGTEEPPKPKPRPPLEDEGRKRTRKGRIKDST